MSTVYEVHCVYAPNTISVHKIKANCLEITEDDGTAVFYNESPLSNKRHIVAVFPYFNLIKEVELPDKEADSSSPQKKELGSGSGSVVFRDKEQKVELK